MAGDLEDFLRRAAQRRQAKTAQQHENQQPAPRRQPQYSDRNRERVVEIEDIDEAHELLTAEVVEDPNSIAARIHRLEDARRAAAKAEEEAHQKMRSVKQKVKKKKVVVKQGQFTGDPASDLINALRHPGGIQQAILLREILDPPEHRW